jgi:aminotransferase in exopolysaccharide biosynthesis
MTAPGSSLPANIVAAIRSVTGPTPVVLHEPYFGGREWEYLKACLDSTFVSSVGKFVDRFEVELAAFTGSKHAVAVVNGTAALHVALQLSGVRRDDEVIVPAVSFVATTNAVVYCGAVPHFADSEEATLGMDAHALRDYLRAAAEIRSGTCVNKATGRVIRAVVPMHTFGHPLDIDAMQAVAADFKLALVEDAAESLGSMIGDRHAGTYGRIAAVSFNGNKTVTTGGGGAVLTNDPAIAKHAKHLTTTAKVPHKWAFVHDETGYNYRMPNLNAALGCAQLEQLPTLLAAKRRLYERYAKAFADVRGAKLFHEPAGRTSNYWLQAIVLDENRAGERDAVLEATNGAGLMTRPIWTLMHKLPPYLDCPRMDLPVAESLEARVINIPSSAQLGFEGR